MSHEALTCRAHRAASRCSDRLVFESWHGLLQFIEVGPPRFELESDAPEAPSIAKLTHGPRERFQTGGAPFLPFAHYPGRCHDAEPRPVAEPVLTNCS